MGKQLTMNVHVKHLRKQINGTNRITQPGFFEAGTVAHCGTSLMGDFAKLNYQKLDHLCKN